MTKKETKAQKTVYKRLTDAFVLEHLMDFYETSDLGFKTFCTERAIPTKRESLRRIADKVDFFKMKEGKVSFSFAQRKLQAYLSSRKVKAETHLRHLQESNKVLTTDETEMLIETCKFMACMGMGIDSETMLDAVNFILKKRIEDQDFVPVRIGVVNQIVANNKTLRKLRGNSIDPKRVRQANTDVRNAMFVRLENFVKLLHSQGKIEWSSFKDIPATNISNMDELAVNAHDHRHKIIAPVSVLLAEGLNSRSGRIYQETSAGDNKMPMHVTLALTSQPNGKFYRLNFWLFYI